MWMMWMTGSLDGARGQTIDDPTLEDHHKDHQR